MQDTRSGQTPLHMAVGKNDLLMTQFLLKKGADSSLKNFNGQTPEELASSKGYHKLARLLWNRSVGDMYDDRDRLKKMVNQASTFAIAIQDYVDYLTQVPSFSLLATEAIRKTGKSSINLLQVKEKM